MRVTLPLIDKYNPCKSGRDNLLEYYPKVNFSIRDFLTLENIPYNDKIWLASRIIPTKALQFWSLACASSQLSNTTDSRVRDCLEVVEKFLNNKATKEELSAESAAWSAESAESAARSAAWSAWSAAESAAWSAESAESAAWSAARSAARSAAWSAESAESAESAARSAESAARSAARSAAWSAAESAAWSAAESAAKLTQEEVNIILLIDCVNDYGNS